MQIKSSLLAHYLLSAFFVFTIVFGVIFYSANKFEAFFVAQLGDSLQSRAKTVELLIENNQIENRHCGVLKESDPDIRVTIISTEGVVLCDNQADFQEMDNHLNRPEVAQAIKGTISSNLRFSSTLNTSLLYTAIPWSLNENSLGVIRTAYPLYSIDRLIDDLFSHFYILLSIILIGITGAIVYSYRRINLPLAQIVNQAQLLSQGNIKDEIPTYDIHEINQLGKALNTTFSQLDHLENLRQEFVSNVSHELKTPIATIRSYVETLLDGASLNEKDLNRFLEIVLKQNNRLSNIVDDLLMLSRLENAPRDQLLDSEEHDIYSLAEDAKSYCQERAKLKKITLTVECSQSYYVSIDYSLMLQAFTNLIDNAIKYSPDKTEIQIIVEQSSPSSLLVRFKDQGPGIAEIHIPRLFERFYRVDKSRSRKEGGTGLGLAIVKHILLLHKGAISVKNNSGAGCCFSVTLRYKN